MKTSMLTIFLGKRKKAHSTMMKTKKEIIEEFISFSANMYSLKTKKEEMKKANEV